MGTGIARMQALMQVPDLPSIDFNFTNFVTASFMRTKTSVKTSVKTTRKVGEKLTIHQTG